jgi:tetratricopeptide (TPR) repeat protein
VQVILRDRPWLGATRDLALDYWLTGFGFDRYAMALSSYMLLVNVPFMFYAQNLYLDVWLAQGLPGLLGLAGMCLLSLVHAAYQLRHDEPAHRALRIAALSGLCYALLYGVVDDPFFEDWRTAPALFLLLGVMLRANGSRLARRQLLGAGAGAGFAILAFVGAVAVMPSLRASWHAGLGALWQTQFELANFHEGSAWGLQDALRLARRDALAPAIHEYETALALDPDNAVANRRLGQIALCLGRYDSARRHLEAAYAVRPTHRSAALLVGESRAVDGDVASAADAWRGVFRREDALNHRFNWYYYFVKDEPRAELVRRASELAGESE